MSGFPRRSAAINQRRVRAASNLRPRIVPVQCVEDGGHHDSPRLVSPSRRQNISQPIPWPTAHLSGRKSRYERRLMHDSAGACAHRNGQPGFTSWHPHPVKPRGGIRGGINHRRRQPFRMMLVRLVEPCRMNSNFRSGRIAPLRAGRPGGFIGPAEKPPEQVAGDQNIRLHRHHRTQPKEKDGHAIENECSHPGRWNAWTLRSGHAEYQSQLAALRPHDSKAAPKTIFAGVWIVWTKVNVPLDSDRRPVQAAWGRSCNTSFAQSRRALSTIWTSTDMSCPFTR